MNLKIIQIMKPIFSILITTIILSGNLFAQESHNHDHNHDCSHHSSEVAVAGTAVYFPGEKAFAPGIHAHFVRNIIGTRFGIGLGFEKVFDEHGHNTIGIIGSYRPLDKLTLMLSPGLTLSTHEKSAQFSAHFETTYEFVYKMIHFGPVVGIGWDGEDYHIGAGLHVGIGF